MKPIAFLEAQSCAWILACVLASGITTAVRAQGTDLPSSKYTTISSRLCDAITQQTDTSQVRFLKDPHRADERQLLSAVVDGNERNARPAARARIEPLSGASRGGADWLRRGRALAQIISDGPYPTLGIERDTQFLWVDNADTVSLTPSLTLGPRALMVHQDSLPGCRRNGQLRVVQLSLHVEKIPDHVTGRDRVWRSLPSARFFYARYTDRGGGQLLTLFAESINETCPGGTCCSVCGPASFSCVTMHANALRLQ